MKKIAILVGFLFLTLSPNPSYAEALYFHCNDSWIGPKKWKYEKGLMGGKVYYEKNNTEWVFNKKTKIEDDKIIIDGWYTKNKNKKCIPKCYYTFIISLLPIKVNENTFVNYKEFHTNDCVRDNIADSNLCSNRKAGSRVQKGQCMLQKPLKP